MRIKLNFPKPSAHWLGLANIIMESDGLRGGITLVGDEQGTRLFGKVEDENPIPVLLDRQPRFAVNTLAGKLAFLQWLHDRFPKVQSSVPTRFVQRRPLQSFYHGGAITRSIRFSPTSAPR